LIAASPRRPGWISICLAVSTILAFTAPALAGQADFTPSCDHPGWFPAEFGLKDHHLFWHAGYYYLVSTYLPYDRPPAQREDRFVYARSPDLCSWEILAPVLPDRQPGTWDEKAVWAPFVMEEAGVYYLYFTGVTAAGTQRILLATTTDPAAPSSWEIQEMYFQPDHAGALWVDGAWADCRDPTVIKVDGLYYLYYAGRDQAGGIIGLATAPTPSGPWTDQGSLIPPLANATPESPTLARHEDIYYLFYNLAGEGGYFRSGTSPTGPWQDPLPFRPGWAHEIWQSPGQGWLTSYLTGYTVSIAPLTWAGYAQPPHPFIGLIRSRLLLPLAFKP
jgi:hypothetical protein